MKQLNGKLFLHNGIVKPISEFVDYSSNPGVFVYEVVRVISGVSLFLEEHLERLKKSIESTGLACPISLVELESELLKFIKANKLQVGNVFIMLHFFENSFNYWIYEIPHNYPSESDQRNGVEVGILEAVRNNPVAKVVQPHVRERANKMIKDKHLFEVLLVDLQGNIREGSRSNVFFIKGDKVFTTPLDLVLNGITRQKTIEVIQRLGLELVETPISLQGINSYDSIFLTGTSIKVLPIHKILDYKFDTSNAICQKIYHAYNQLINSYVDSKIKNN